MGAAGMTTCKGNKEGGNGEGGGMEGGELGGGVHFSALGADLAERLHVHLERSAERLGRVAVSLVLQQGFAQGELFLRTSCCARGGATDGR